MTRSHSLRAVGAALLGACALTVSACGSGADDASTAASSQPTVTVTHAQGDTEVPANPAKVAVLDLGAVDTLDALGVEIAGLPKKNLPDYMSKFADEKYVDLGSVKEPDVEALARLDPDLVVVGFRTASQYEDLKGTYPVVDVTFDYANFVDNMGERTLELAKVWDRVEEAKADLKEIEDVVANVKAEAADAGSAMFLSTSGGEVTAYGPGSRFGTIFTEAGLSDAMDGTLEESAHGSPISYEVIRDANPDWIFVNDRDAAVGAAGGQAAEKILDNELVGETTAWKTGQVVYVNPSRWYIVMHGLTNTKEMFAEIETALTR